MTDDKPKITFRIRQTPAVGLRPGEAACSKCTALVEAVDLRDGVCASCIALAAAPAALATPADVRFLIPQDHPLLEWLRETSLDRYGHTPADVMTVLRALDEFHDDRVNDRDMLAAQALLLAAVNVLVDAS